MHISIWPKPFVLEHAVVKIMDLVTRFSMKLINYFSWKCKNILHTLVLCVSVVNTKLQITQQLITVVHLKMSSPKYYTSWL